eukprot:GHRQ01028164.1.p1 GENE.GHRQ01028164.1~~GHRQ01028164.1.p1  ORF type:complete len:164 (+),score=69.50 GHRQ01028164.1:23-514(+)
MATALCSRHQQLVLQFSQHLAISRHMLFIMRIRFRVLNTWHLLLPFFDPPADSNPEHKPQQAEEYRRALYDMLSCMRDVRKRGDRTDAMFEPLKDSATLLQTVGIQLGDVVLKQLDYAEFKWKGLKKKMLNRREQLAALQQAEAVEIRRKSDAFAERVDDYRK